MWVLWSLHLMPGFWLLMVGSALPLLLSVSRVSVAHLLRPVEGAAEDSAPILAAVALERGLRAAIIILAALFLAYVWDIDLIQLTARDTFATRLIRGGLSAIVIVLVADFLWRLARALIDRKLTSAAPAENLEVEEARRRARLRTLLPILRNVLMVVVMTVGRDDGAVRPRGRDRTLDRRRRRGRRRGRLRRPDRGQGRDQRRVLSAGRRIPDRRIHPERQLQGHGRNPSRCVR